MNLAPLDGHTTAVVGEKCESIDKLATLVFRKFRRGIFPRESPVFTSSEAANGKAPAGGLPLRFEPSLGDRAVCEVTYVYD
jgi:hypothetical protein